MARREFGAKRRLFLELLNEAHASSGRSMQDVAERCGLDKSSVSFYLRGHRRPRRNSLLALCLYGWHLDPYETDEILRAGGYRTLMDWDKAGWDRLV